MNSPEKNSNSNWKCISSYVLHKKWWLGTKQRQLLQRQPHQANAFHLSGDHLRIIILKIASGFSLVEILISVWTNASTEEGTKINHLLSLSEWKMFSPLWKEATHLHDNCLLNGIICVSVVFMLRRKKTALLRSVAWAKKKKKQRQKHYTYVRCVQLLDQKATKKKKK